MAREESPKLSARDYVGAGLQPGVRSRYDARVRRRPDRVERQFQHRMTLGQGSLVPEEMKLLSPWPTGPSCPQPPYRGTIQFAREREKRHQR